MNSLYAGVCSRADWPFFETSCQSMTPSSTIASQNRIVFAVELEFTIASLISYRAVTGVFTASCAFAAYYH